MPDLSKDSSATLLQKNTLPRERVRVPEWDCLIPDCHVWVRTISGKELTELQQSMMKKRGNSIEQYMVNMHAKMCVRAIVDDKGERIYADGDADRLGDQSAAALSRIYAVASKLAGITPEDEKELTDFFDKTSGT